MKEDRSLILLNAWFSDYKNEISITSFFETRKMPFFGLVSLLVSLLRICTRQWYLVD